MFRGSCVTWSTARIGAGPLLFLVHINDLPDEFTEQIVVYPDDIVIVTSGAAEKDKMNNVLKILQKRWDNNKITINEKKTDILSMKKKTKGDFKLTDKLKCKDQFKYLRVYIDKNCLLNTILVHCRLNYQGYVGLFNKIRSFFSRKSPILFYNAFVKSSISYAILV